MFARLPKFHLLAFLLLFFNAQLSVAVHAVEHPFHNHVASCDVFMAAEQQQALPTLEVVTLILPQSVEQAVFHQTSVELFFFPHYQTRAPPFFR